MCSPEVAKVVRERAARDGFSRRNFLKFGGMTAAGLAVASALPMRLARAQAMNSVVDLSHVLSPDGPTYLPNEGPIRETVVKVNPDGFYIQRWTIGEHTGTHVDIPAHFVDGAETVDVYDVGLLVSPAVVIDISEKAAAEPNATVEVADIEAWEAANGEIPAGALVFMYSGWDAKWNDVPAFRGDPGDGSLNFPGFGAEASTFLVEQRDIHGIGVDTLSLDPGNSSTFDTHVTICSAGKYGIEGVANLSAIMGKSATVVVGVPRYEAGSGGPARVLALVEG
ncbi:MAG: cyclase family protein [Anaerolineae bacterium]|nr:cyclase family protein [Anaerolineae bacterium]